MQPSCRIDTKKRVWDMSTSQSNSVLETWTLAGISVLIFRSTSDLADDASNEKKGVRPARVWL
jgi:hypothetical protein